MKIYVAAKLEERRRARALMSALERRKHTITYDWTSVESEEGTPLEHRPAVAQSEVEGVKQADVVVLIAHENGCGQYVEMGVALAMGIPVLVINYDCRNNVFFHHPLCVWVEHELSLVEALMELDRKRARSLKTA